MQNSFVPGVLAQDELPVPEGECIIPNVVDAIRKARERGMAIIVTQDWHPDDHVSFSSRYDVPPFTVVDRDDGRNEITWPNHCVAGTPGVEIVAPVQAELDNGEYYVFRKGFPVGEDAYSGF